MPVAIDITNVKRQVLTKTWQYLLENFHKFSEGNKIKVALALSVKDMPTHIEGGLAFTKMPTVVVDGKELEIEIGENPSSNNAESSTEATRDTDEDK